MGQSFGTLSPGALLNAQNLPGVDVIIDQLACFYEIELPQLSPQDIMNVSQIQKNCFHFNFLESRALCWKCIQYSSATTDLSHGIDHFKFV